MKHVIAILCAAVAIAGCGEDSRFVECEQHANCSLGPGGLCEQNPVTGNRWCTYPCNADNGDNICSSGRCWSDFDVGDGVSGTCYGGADAGVGPMDDASVGIDAAVTDAMDAAQGDASVGGALAAYVLGQATFFTEEVNQGGVGTDSLFAPQGVFANSSMDGLFVVDSGNQRVLSWGAPITMNKQPAVNIYGQTTGTGTTGGTTAAKFNFLSSDGLEGEGVAGDGQRVVVTDSGNHRVLIWNDAIGNTGIDDGAPASVVLGQTNFTNSGSGNGQGQMQYPRGVWTDGTRLVVADTGNNRVLIWNTFPTANGALPDIVLGQSDFGMSAAADPPSASSLSSPRGVHFDGSRLWVADSGNHRVLVWTSFPVSNGQAADFVLGQVDFTGNVENGGGFANTTSLNRPFDVTVGQYNGSSALFVADKGNKRVLLYSPLPSTTGAAATTAYGVPDLVTVPDDLDPPSASTFAAPNGVSVHQGILYVTDAVSRDGEIASPITGGRNRVMVFNLP